MNYGRVGRGEQGVAIRLDQRDRLAHNCSAWADCSRMLEYQHERPKQKGMIVTAFLAVPLNRASPRRGAHQVILTELQRVAASERLRRARQSLGMRSSQTETIRGRAEGPRETLKDGRAGP